MMFQQDYSTQYGSISQPNLLHQFKTQRSQPTTASYSDSTSSFAQQYTQTPSPLPPLKKSEKDLLITKLKGRIQQLQQDLFSQQRQRKIEIDFIKKHVEILEKEMNFVGEENQNLMREVRELRESNTNLVRALGEREEMRKVMGEYQLGVFVKKEEEKRKRISRSKSRKISTVRKGNSQEAAILKSEIENLNQKIKRSQSKLNQVRMR